MPRDLTNWGGAETADEQFPVHLVEIALASPWRRTTLDASVFFNLTDETSAALATGAGLTEFPPQADLMLPRLAESLDEAMDAIVIRASNRDDYWYSVLAAGTYRNTVVRIWEGRVTLADGAHPDTAVFAGFVKKWHGVLSGVNASKSEVSLRVERSEIAVKGRFPRQNYTPDTFTRCPTPGSLIVFGYSERYL